MLQPLISLVLAAASIPGGALGLALPQAATAAAADQVVPAPVRPEELRLGGDLRVGDELIPEAVIKRELVYLAGSIALESSKLDLLIKAEIERRVAAGEDRRKFEVTPAEVDEATAKTLQQIKDQYPTESIETVLLGNKLDMNALTRQVLQGKLFDRVFLPEDPAEWPVVTSAAISGSAGQEFVDKLKESYAQRKEQGLADDASQAGMAMMNTFLRKMVIGALTEAATIESGSDGLPPDVALRVDGQSLRTDDMYRQIAGLLSQDDVQRARTWVAKTTAVRQELARREFLLQGEEARSVFEAHNALYQAPFTLQVVAVNFKRFPSMDYYRSYFLLLESFKRSIQAELTDAVLAEHMGRAGPLLGNGKVNCEVILCAAVDPKSGAAVPGGWARAAQRASEATALLAEAGGANWGEVLDTYSDFWDAPQAATQTGQAPPMLRNKGRFGSLHRNELVQRLAESEFTMFLTGQSLTDLIFFSQEENSMDGPFKGQQGYYITRVLAREPAERLVSLGVANERELVLQDYVTTRFNAFAQECLQKAQVQGL